MSAQNVVIVESPAKAKTINKYLGGDYKVIASFGHVRDLPPKDGSVRPDDDFAMSWMQDDRSKKHVTEITKAVKAAQTVFLASDPDREGEAIAWHVRQILEEKGALKDKNIQRVTFNEITKRAVTTAIEHPRNLDQDLIDAYLARRALDYLVGFRLSPVLWRKLPGSKSAGRVQSVALRLICEREAEIEAFKAEEYWSIEAQFQNDDGAKVPAKLSHFDGKKLSKMDINSEEMAKDIVARLSASSYKVLSVEPKKSTRNPYAPFTTSTLQQDASSKLGMGATQTMRTAQKLYEGVDIGGETVGLITYMRTDGVTLSQDAIEGARKFIQGYFGESYLPEKPRIYKSKAKNAQEAHEAIRPTDLSRTPKQLQSILSKEEYALYSLIWKRTIASQMSSAIMDKVVVEIGGSPEQATFRATGSVIAFDGFLKVYHTRNDVEKNGTSDDDKELPKLTPNDPLAFEDGAIKGEQHFTQPPPRYSEASLVKKMEELGIGRPSTYASIMQVLKDRDYVILDKRRFYPQDRGRIVTTFLTNFFSRYVQYDFTADLENQLDSISNGDTEYKQVLADFWTGFSAAIDDATKLTITEVIDTLDESLGDQYFPPKEDGTNPRACPSCDNGRLGLKLGRHSAFIGCSNYPDCKYTRDLIKPAEGEEHQPLMDGPTELGTDPATGMPVTLRKGPYGHYVQLGPMPGEEDEDKKAKPKRASIPRGTELTSVTLEQALGLLSLPREIGIFPDTGKKIYAGLGRFGPYLRHGASYVSLKGDDHVLTVGINRAIALVAEKLAKTPEPKEVGAHPKNKKPITLHIGRYGPYVKHGRTMASLPKTMKEEDVTLEIAVQLLDEKTAKTKKAAPAKADKTADNEKKAAKKPAAKKKAATPKKTAAKKTATKKTTAKKTTKAKEAEPQTTES